MGGGKGCVTGLGRVGLKGGVDEALKFFTEKREKKALLRGR